MAERPSALAEIVLAHFIVSDDVERSRRFYTEVLGGRLAFSGPGGLTYVALSNTCCRPADRGRDSRRQRHRPHPRQPTPPCHGRPATAATPWPPCHGRHAMRSLVAYDR
jgi:catechol 2,3-dioxygenase-like lactoylglutathione lyase family enzyme